MPRLGLANMSIGFVLLTLAAAAGAFVANETTTGYLADPAMLGLWAALMQRAAHGHTALFGLIHVALGLTLPYSRWSSRVKAAQTAALGAGSVAMAVGLPLRGVVGPSASADLLGILVGAALTAALAALGAHSAGLAAKLMQRP